MAPAVMTSGASNHLNIFYLIVVFFVVALSQYLILTPSAETCIGHFLVESGGDVKLKSDT